MFSCNSNVDHELGILANFRSDALLREIGQVLQSHYGCPWMWVRSLAKSEEWAIKSPKPNPCSTCLFQLYKVSSYYSIATAPLYETIPPLGTTVTIFGGRSWEVQNLWALLSWLSSIFLTLSIHAYLSDSFWSLLVFPIAASSLLRIWGGGGPEERQGGSPSRTRHRIFLNRAYT